MPISISGDGAITGATTSYSFDQSVSVGGTVTYEDVTNVDSVGVITARGGLDVGVGGTILTTTTAGRIGIGSEIPSVTLDVKSPASGSTTVAEFTKSGSNSVYLKLVNDNNDLGFVGYESENLTFYTNNVLRGLLTDDGNGSYLRLNHNTTAGSIGAGDTLGTISFTDYNGGIFAQIKGENDGTESNLDYPGRISFWTTADNASAPQEGMRIERDGKVHIGDDLGDRQAECLQVIRNGGGQGTNDCLVWFETGQNDWCLQFNHTETASGNAYFINCLQQGTQRGRAWFDGSNMNWATSSDYRLKENVTPVTNGISEVKRLNPVNYRFIENPTVPQVGFLAHELDEVCPYAVGGEKDAVNEDGSINPQMVDKSHVVPLLTAALQEAIAKIETLEQRLTDAGL